MLSAKLENELTSKLVKEFAPQQIILFGSYAWGTPTEDSDIDIYVIVPQSNQTPTQRATRAYRALRDILSPLDIVVRTQAEALEGSSVYASLDSEVIERGRVLYG